MGTRRELAALTQMLDATGARPLIDRTLPMDRGRRGLRGDGGGRAFGKIVFTADGPTWSPGPAPASVRCSPAGSSSAATTSSSPPARRNARTTCGGPARRRRARRRPRRRRAGRGAGSAPPGVAGLAGARRPAWSTSAPSPRWTPGPGSEQLAVNLLAPAVLTRSALPALRSARGTVVLVNSGAGLVAHPEWSAYAASKLGLRPRRLPSRRGGVARRPRHVGLPRPDRHADAAEGARAGGQGLRPRRPGSIPPPWSTRSCTSSTCPATPRSPT